MIAVCIVAGYICATVVLALLYFQRFNTMRPPLGVMNMRDVVFALVAIAAMPYMYLALYYNSRSQFDRVVQVYQKLLKYQPGEATAYINIGEAYMSFSPPKFDSALPYYLKALQIEPRNSFAALRIGEVYAQKGDPYRGQALRYLNLARSDRSKNPTAAAEADKILHEMGAS